MSKLYLKEIVPECIALNEGVHKLISEIFADKTTDETIAGIMLLSIAFEKSVEERIGLESATALKNYILNTLEKSN